MFAQEKKKKKSFNATLSGTHIPPHSSDTHLNIPQLFITRPQNQEKLWRHISDLFPVSQACLSRVPDLSLCPRLVHRDIT